MLRLNVSNLMLCAAAFVLACSAGAVFSGEVSRCEGSFDGADSNESGYQDLGNGYVAYGHSSYWMGMDFFDPKTGKEGHEPSFVSTDVLIEACASGTTIEVPVYYCFDGVGGKCKKKQSYDFRGEVNAILDQAAGPEPTSFEFLAAKLKKVSPETQVTAGAADDWESCACHVAYPRLRGDKVKFIFPKD